MRTLIQIAECFLAAILACILVAIILFIFITLCPPFAEIIIETVREGIPR